MWILNEVKASEKQLRDLFFHHVRNHESQTRATTSMSNMSPKLNPKEKVLFFSEIAAPISYVFYVDTCHVSKDLDCGVGIFHMCIVQ